MFPYLGYQDIFKNFNIFNKSKFYKNIYNILKYF